MNIAFVANGQKCQFFHKISQEICKLNDKVNIFWICIGKFQLDYLISENIDEKRILLLNWDYSTKENNPIGEYKLNELINSDRVLKNHKSKGLEYLINIQEPFFNFVTGNKIKFIFGETTWAHEILFDRICEDKFVNKCKYLHPQSVRIPNGRFAFLHTEFQNRIESTSEYVLPDSMLSDFVIPIVPEVPSRVAIVAADVKKTLGLKFTFKRILGFVFTNRLKKYPNDSLQHLRPPLKVRISKFLDFEMNKFYYNFFLHRQPIEILEGRNYFFMTLHMQPEASVDVVGRYYEDQLILIKNVWRILPNNYFLVVKEHTNAIGNRGRKFFSECLKLRNLIIIHENANSHDILNNSKAVFTNSGTVALEGALFGKHVFLFSKIFFDKLKFCHKISLDDLKYCSNYFNLLEQCIINDYNKMDIDEYSKYILQSSFEGVIDPHNGSNEFVDMDNISTIASSFNTFIGKASEV